MTSPRLALACAIAALALSSALPAQAAEDTKVALTPGGPHPYFAAWEQAGKDAARDFKLGAADYKVPQKWELSQQNELLESLVTQGYNAFLIFPGDPVGSVATVGELVDTGGWLRPAVFGKAAIITRRIVGVCAGLLMAERR